MRCMNRGSTQRGAPRRPSPQEKLAADIVVAETGGQEWVLVDDGSIDGMRDFDVVLPDGSREALEVTTASDARDRMKQDRTMRQTERYPWVPDPGHRSWSVTVKPEGVNIKELHQSLAGLLAQLDDADIERVGWPRRDPQHPAIDQLRALGVVTAFCLGEWPSPMISMSPSLGGAFAADDVTEAVQAEINDSGNRRKLRQSGHPRRHLFVWVDWVGAAQPAFHSIVDPQTSPVMNNDVTDVWAAPDGVEFFNRRLGGPVWHCRTAGWERLGPS